MGREQEEAEVILFEGMVGVDVEGIAYDAYATVRVQGMGSIVRWYGTLGWVTEAPPKTDFQPGGFFDVSLSDGREAKIRIPYLSAREDGRLDFLGVGLPPGFEWFGPEAVSAELKSTTPRWRTWSGRTVNALAFISMVMAIWSHDYKWQYFVTGIMAAALGALLLAPTPSHGRQIKESDSASTD